MKNSRQKKAARKRRRAQVQTWTAAMLVRLIHATCRVRVRDQAGVVSGEQQGPFIYVCWHNRLLFFPPCSPRQLRAKTRALASGSGDGEAAARYIRRFGIGSVRGSSSRGGFRALVQLRKLLAEGTHVFLTPDGPRGPKYRIQPGPVLLARKSGASVIPVTLNASAYWELTGWDRTQVAKPFAALDLVIGPPVTAEELSALSVDEARERVREALLAITRD